MSTAWKGELTFGDLAIAVVLTHGPKASESGLKNIHAGCGSPVGVKDYCKGPHGTLRNKNLIVKAGEFDGRLIPIPAAELDAIAPAEAKSLPLTLTTPVDPLFFADTYFLRPDATSEANYAALRELLQGEGLLAITQIPLHRERYLIIRPGEYGLIAHTLYYAQESRSLDEFRCMPAPIATLEAFRSAAASLKATFDPRATTDAYPPKLHGLIKRLAETPSKGAKAKKAA